MQQSAHDNNMADKVPSQSEPGSASRDLAEKIGEAVRAHLEEADEVEPVPHTPLRPTSHNAPEPPKRRRRGRHTTTDAEDSCEHPAGPAGSSTQQSTNISFEMDYLLYHAWLLYCQACASGLGHLTRKGQVLNPGRDRREARSARVDSMVTSTLLSGRELS